nr:NUDIX hydrolase [Nakamurella flavida]
MFSVVGTRRVYDGAICAVRVDEVVMPGGGVAKREVVEHDLAVAVVALREATDGPEIALIEQYRHPLGRRLWELPAGLMDADGEPAHEAAARELAEETGLAADDWSVLVDVVASPGFLTEAVRVYLAQGVRDVGRDAAVDDEEADLRLVWVPLAVAVQATFDGLVVNASAVAGILATAALRSGAATARAAFLPGPDDAWTVNRSGTPRSAPGLPGVPGA